MEDSGGNFYCNFLRFKIQLVSLIPDPLDIIELAAPLDHTAKVHFMLGLANPAQEPRRFIARFTPESDSIIDPIFTVGFSLAF